MSRLLNLNPVSYVQGSYLNNYHKKKHEFASKAEVSFWTLWPFWVTYKQLFKCLWTFTGFPKENL